MNKKLKLITAVVVALSVIGLSVWLLYGHNIAVLNPQGPIAEKQRNLLVFAASLSLIILVPVFTLLFYISWKFRAGNKKAKYRPDWDKNILLESIWWGIPCLIILVLGTITWRSSHDLDPYRALDSSVKPVNVQVVALQWKWLFIYPEQHVASVNMFQIPVGTPINFTITSDAPMNSFWLPNLGGQVYAMSGMSTKLHLMADHAGDYNGSSANISGEGFSKMKFVARAGSKADFDKWVQNIKRSSGGLNMQVYNELAKPATLDRPIFFALQEGNLYDQIIIKYMGPAHDNHTVGDFPSPPANDSTSNYDDNNNSDTTNMRMQAMEGM